MRFVYLLYSIIMHYIILSIYQMSHYNIKEYTKYFLRNFLYYNLAPLISLVIILIYNNLIINIILSIFLFAFLIIHLFMKPRLKATLRIIRAFIISILFSTLLAFTKINYLNLFYEYIVILILFIENIISNILNKKYLKKAQDKLSNYKNNVIAITGSYGKTTTKNIFCKLLNAYENSVMTPNSYNTPLGIAKFINNSILANIDSVVLEFGASKPNDIVELTSLYHPDFVVVTEIGRMHLNGFHGINNIIKEKMSITNGCRLAILNYENEYIREYPKENINYISYGINYGMYKAKNIRDNEFDFYFKDNYLCHIRYNLDGEYQKLNILACLSYLHYFGYDLDIARRRIELLENTRSRLQIKKYNKHTIIDDSFNSNYSGFCNALELLAKNNSKRILITPGIVELSKYEKEVMKSLSNKIASVVDVVILVGINRSRILYEELVSYNIEIYVAYSFREAYKIYKAVRGKDESCCLIENDLPEIYRRGLLF